MKLFIMALILSSHHVLALGPQDLDYSFINGCDMELMSLDQSVALRAKVDFDRYLNKRVPRKGISGVFQSIVFYSDHHIYKILEQAPYKVDSQHYERLVTRPLEQLKKDADTVMDPHLSPEVERLTYEKLLYKTLKFQNEVDKGQIIMTVDDMIKYNEIIGPAIESAQRSYRDVPTDELSIRAHYFVRGKRGFEVLFANERIVKPTIQRLYFELKGAQRVTWALEDLKKIYLKKEFQVDLIPKLTDIVEELDLKNPTKNSLFRLLYRIHLERVAEEGTVFMESANVRAALDGSFPYYRLGKDEKLSYLNELFIKRAAEVYGNAG